MIYEVIWYSSAEQELAGLWLEAADRDAFARLVDELEVRLARGPTEVGEPRGGTARIYLEADLAVAFGVDTANRRVEVRKIWRWPKSAR